MSNTDPQKNKQTKTNKQNNNYKNQKKKIKPPQKTTGAELR
jgi:hypothetical protein